MSLVLPKDTKIVQDHLRADIPEFRVGDTVTVHQKIQEGGKERVSPFTGLVIARSHGNGANATFTVRAVLSGIGVERTFPLHSPRIERIEP